MHYLYSTRYGLFFVLCTLLTLTFYVIPRRSMEKPSRRSIDQSSSDRPAAERHSIERPSSDRRPTVERSSTDRRRRSPSPAVAETLLPSQAKIKQEEEEEQNALGMFNETTRNIHFTIYSSLV